MAREEVIDKLNDFLARHSPLTEECHVVYLMVAVRKILEHEKDKESLLLRFYCDWIVHTEKDRITDDIREMMVAIYKTVKSEIERPYSVQAMSPVMQFAYMDKLKDEMGKFLADRGIDKALIDSGWLEFVKILVKVLENQPINKPTTDIKLFSFTPAADQCVKGIIIFEQPINGYDHYNFANAY
jgi:hypothetical protein